MSLYALASGVLIGDPVRRESASGKTFATATIRASDGAGGAVLVGLLAFGTEGERLAAHAKGSPICASGRLEVRKYTARDGEERFGLTVIVSEIASPQRRPKARSDAAPSPRRRPSYPAARARVPAPVGPDPSDEIPF